MTSLEKPCLIKTISDLRSWRRLQKDQSVGFVPTMGALHDGHCELLKHARRECDQVVLSIFVNPAQFGPNEDLDTYPRTMEKDLERARNEGVDAVFFPSASLMYPEGYSTYVEEGSVSQPLCGKFRESFFKGVATIVLKLFHLVQPQVAYFGLKDAQQYFVISKMVEDLNLDLEVKGIPTVREKDGLALSSRNVYLSSSDRKKASAVYETLRWVEAELKAKAPIAETLDTAKARLQENSFDVQYLECLSIPGLCETREVESERTYLVAVAAFLGGTRLIDNLIIEP